MCRAVALNEAPSRSCSHTRMTRQPKPVKNSVCFTSRAMLSSIFSHHQAAFVRGTLKCSGQPGVETGTQLVFRESGESEAKREHPASSRKRSPKTYRAHATNRPPPTTANRHLWLPAGKYPANDGRMLPARPPQTRNRCGESSKSVAQRSCQFSVALSNKWHFGTSRWVAGIASHTTRGRKIELFDKAVLSCRASAASAPSSRIHRSGFILYPPPYPLSLPSRTVA